MFSIKKESGVFFINGEPVLAMSRSSKLSLLRSIFSMFECFHVNVTERSSLFSKLYSGEIQGQFSDHWQSQSISEENKKSGFGLGFIDFEQSDGCIIKSQSEKLMDGIYINDNLASDEDIDKELDCQLEIYMSLSLFFEDILALKSRISELEKNMVHLAKINETVEFKNGSFC